MTLVSFNIYFNICLKTSLGNDPFLLVSLYINYYRSLFFCFCVVLWCYLMMAMLSNPFYVMICFNSLIYVTVSLYLSLISFIFPSYNYYLITYASEHTTLLFSTLIILSKLYFSIYYGNTTVLNSMWIIVYYYFLFCSFTMCYWVLFMVIVLVLPIYLPSYSTYIIILVLDYRVRYCF